MRAFLLLFLLMTAACGDVLFIPSPPVANSSKAVTPPPQKAGSPNSVASPPS